MSMEKPNAKFDQDWPYTIDIPSCLIPLPKEALMAVPKDKVDTVEKIEERAIETKLIDTPDPWKHRSKGMVCATCMFFVIKVTDQPHVKTLGRCRRHAPTMNGYPAVFKSDWCGDHKLDENKI